MPRTEATEATSHHERIKQYLTAAGATAGAAMVAAPADAELIVQVLNTSITDGDVVTIDLDEDGAVDFTLTHTTLGFLPYDNQALYITSDSPGSEVAFFDAFGYGWVENSPMVGDGQIDGNDTFNPTSAVPYGLAYLGFTNNTGTVFSSEFFDVTNRFMGLSIEIAGQTHYGWALMDVGPVVLDPDTSGSFSAVLKAVAYESVPGAPALPEPGTLATLAAGAAGLAAVRRRRDND